MPQASHIVCPHCAALNRVPVERSAESARCGACHRALFDGHPAPVDEAGFERAFNGSPVRRAGFLGLRRNVAIAMGNSRMGRFAPWLEDWADVADEGLRSAARWAREKLKASR